MKRVAVILGLLAISVAVFAQTSPEIEKALLPAPAQMREAATVIKWKPDFTYTTLRKDSLAMLELSAKGELRPRAEKTCKQFARTFFHGEPTAIVRRAVLVDIPELCLNCLDRSDR